MLKLFFKFSIIITAGNVIGKKFIIETVKRESTTRHPVHKKCTCGIERKLTNKNPNLDSAEDIKKEFALKIDSSRNRVGPNIRIGHATIESLKNRKPNKQMTGNDTNLGSAEEIFQKLPQMVTIGKIDGGQDVPRGKYPWMASVIFNNRYQPGGCGATLIASRWAVTAAHCCVIPDDPTIPCPITSIMLGEHDIMGIDDQDTNRKKVKVEKGISHPDHNSTTFTNDIALLKLAEDVDLSVHTPACLPKSGKDFTGQMGSVYGWGWTNYCPKVRNKGILQEVSKTIVSDATCEKASGPYKEYDRDETSPTYGCCITVNGSYAGKITDEMLCAGAQDKDACLGDSGGPLTVKKGHKHTLVGVVSWGAGCAAKGFYGVYAEVANPKLRKWIDDTIAENGGAVYCPTKKKKKYHK